MLAALKRGCAAKGGTRDGVLAVGVLHGSRAACRKRQQAAAVQGGCAAVSDSLGNDVLQGCGWWPLASDGRRPPLHREDAAASGSGAAKGGVNLDVGGATRRQGCGWWPLASDGRRPPLHREDAAASGSGAAKGGVNLDVGGATRRQGCGWWPLASDGRRPTLHREDAAEGELGGGRGYSGFHSGNFSLRSLRYLAASAVLPTASREAAILWRARG
jgi:hypothetical protein